MKKPTTIDPLAEKVLAQRFGAGRTPDKTWPQRDGGCSSTLPDWGTEGRWSRSPIQPSVSAPAKPASGIKKNSSNHDPPHRPNRLSRPRRTPDDTRFAGREGRLHPPYLLGLGFRHRSGPGDVRPLLRLEGCVRPVPGPHLARLPRDADVVRMGTAALSHW